MSIADLTTKTFSGFTFLSTFIGYTVYRFSEVIFAVFILPTNFAAISQRFSMPDFLNIKLFLFIVLVMVIIILIYEKRTVPRIPAIILLPYFGIMALMSISLYWTPNFSYGLSKTGEFVFLGTIAFFAPFFVIKNARGVELFLKTLVFIGCLLCIIILVFKPYSFLYADIKSVSEYPKFQTMLGSNYLFVQHMGGMAALIILYYFMLKKNSLKKFLLLAILLLTILTAIIYSSGKSSIFSLFITIGIMGILAVKIRRNNILINKRVFAFTVTLFLIGGVLISTIGWVFLNRTKALTDPGYYGRVERVENTKIALDLFSERFFGVGIGGFSDYSIEIKGVERFKYPHNIFLDVMSELGIAGFILFASIIISAFAQFFYLIKKYQNTDLFLPANAILCLFIFTLLTSMTSGNINNTALLAWIGIAFALENIYSKSAEIHRYGKP